MTDLSENENFSVSKVNKSKPSNDVVFLIVTFQCEYPDCFKTSSCLGVLDQHMRFNDSNIRYPCAWCDKQLKHICRVNPDRYVQGQKSYNNFRKGETNKRFNCDYQGCAKSFARKDYVVVHVRVHQKRICIQQSGI